MQDNYTANTHYYVVGTFGSIDDAAGTLTVNPGKISMYTAAFDVVPGLFYPNDMYGIDMKYDDGLPRAGRIRYSSATPGIIEDIPQPAAPVNCTDRTDATGSRYNPTSNYRGCDMMISAGF